MTAQTRRSRRVFIPLFIILVVGLVFFLQSRFGKAEVMVEYVLSGDRTDVNSVVVKWEGDNEKTAEAVLSVDPKDPDRFHHQVLSLTKGHYEVEVRVTRTDATSQSKSFEVEVGEGEQSVSLEHNLVREK